MRTPEVLPREDVGTMTAPTLTDFLLALALPYSDHPDYDPEWRP